MTPFLIGLPGSSLDDGGKRPCEDLAHFHTNCAHPASAAERCRGSSLVVPPCATAQRGQVSPPAADRVVCGGLLCAGPKASDRGRRGTAPGACCPRCATKRLSAALRIYCPAVLERRRVATHRGSIGADRAGDRTYKTKAKVRRDHLTPSPSLSRRGKGPEATPSQLPNVQTPGRGIHPPEGDWQGVVDVTRSVLITPVGSCRPALPRRPRNVSPEAPPR